MTRYPEQVAEFDRICDEMLTLHLRKSADYGAEPIAETGLEGVLVRMTDKLHRARRLSSAWAEGAAVSDETIEDTFIDLASYAVIAVVLLRGKWGK